MKIEDIVLLDFDNNEVAVDVHGMDDPEYLEGARERTARSADEFFTGRMTFENAIAVAYLQGMYDCEMIQDEAEIVEVRVDTDPHLDS